MSQQLLEQQQVAAAKEAEMTEESRQLQEQLLSTQAEVEGARAAAKLKQIEHESHAQALSEVCQSAPELPHSCSLQSCQIVWVVREPRSCVPMC